MEMLSEWFYGSLLFVYANEEAYSRLAESIWKHGCVCKKFSLLLVAFTWWDKKTGL